MIRVEAFPVNKGEWYLKTIPVKALQMGDDFVVETISGNIAKGKAGDYLCKDSRGFLYPCAREVFEETYERISPYEFSENML